MKAVCVQVTRKKSEFVEIISEDITKFRAQGPWDGIGGASKRMADNAVKQSKSIIQNGKDFIEWGSILYPHTPLTSTTPAKMLK